MDQTTQALTFNFINLDSFSPKRMVIKKTKKKTSGHADATFNLEFGLCGRKFGVQKEPRRQDKSVLWMFLNSLQF